MFHTKVNITDKKRNWAQSRQKMDILPTTADPEDHFWNYSLSLSACVLVTMLSFNFNWP
jgi:hypothetical protein